ncbi:MULTISPECIES: glycosyltransferase family 4 protein [unclassified Thermotoga]|uniref:glycosyltransferase family 4 protein n=1 Tax=unclassified Thermotoga TaxID=2631113 RepID=UPI000280E6B2|nr:MULTISPECIES: glycosyltransferase family 4 protein [unclassified Thermotoga]AIY85864.1 Glycosyltransferase-like protein [Thermotoga sp. 2812B]EJX26850.1 Glycosyltransferase-like protein [Thermotoga sp. EMP]
MRIGIWLPNFEKFELNKCYGQIALGLREIGHDTALLTNGRGELVDHNENVNVISNIDLKQAREIFSKFDLVIMYTWLSHGYTNWVEVASRVTKVIIKCDSIGRYGITYKLMHPIYKFYIENLWNPFFLAKVSKMKIKTTLTRFNKGLRKHLYYGFLRQSELASKIIIESPKAATNLVTVYSYLGRYDLIDKIVVIPNPVAPVFTRNDLSLQKQNVIVSVGRWNDEAQKNPKDLVKALVEFLKIQPSWEAVLIGPGERILQKYIKKYATSNLEKLYIVGRIPNSEIINYSKKAKIFFSASRWEGFSIAAAEALCLGSTLVASPIESFDYMIHNGFSGTVSISEKWQDLLAALIYEASLWEIGKRNSESIAIFWREKLDRKTIANQILSIISIS